MIPESAGGPASEATNPSRGNMISVMHCVPRVLIVDDDDDIRDVLSEILLRVGYAVEGARDGKSALEQLRTGPRPGVILLDLMMPVMDGATFYQERAKDPQLAAIPVIVLSAHCGPRQARRTFPFATFVPKPVDLTRLLGEIRRVF
jgi:CheY-like chemotaxis protein